MFIEPNIESILATLAKLTSEKKPAWGEMSAQRMVEHLTDSVQVSTGKIQLELLIPEEKIEKMQAFLASDKAMAKNIEVPFAKKETPVRNEELELAIDELVDEWLAFEEFYEENPSTTQLHPFYGQLDFEQWKQLHAKHFTHHFQQFELI
jgi:hypothetical protein